MPRLPETKWHGAWILSDLPPAGRCDNYGRSEHLAGSGRQRERKGPRLLPDLWNAGLSDIRRNAGMIAVNATSLDDPGQFNPQVVTYTIRGHAWDTIDSSLQKFERMPPG